MSNITADTAPNKINVLICLKGCRIENKLAEKKYFYCKLFSTCNKFGLKVPEHIDAKML